MTMGNLRSPSTSLSTMICSGCISLMMILLSSIWTAIAAPPKVCSLCKRRPPRKWSQAAWVHDRLCASPGGLERPSPIAPYGGAGRTPLVVLLGPAILGQIRGADLENGLKGDKVPEQMRLKNK